LYKISEKIAFLDFPYRIGRPRGCEVGGVVGAGRMFLIAEIVEVAVFLLKRILDLLALTVCPDQEIYLLRQSFIIIALLEVAVVKMTRSPANKRQFKEEQDLAILKPRRLWWNSREMTSVPIIKRKGDRGSP
jgi:hypothetical protein